MTAPADSPASLSPPAAERLFFTGNHELVLDAKWRLTIPSKFRAGLVPNEKSRRVMVAAHPQQSCLMVFSLHEWELFLRPLLSVRGADPTISDWKEWLTSYSEEQELDQAGRVAISPGLRDPTGLHENRKVVFVGAGYRCQVWDQRAYSEMMAARAARLRTSQPPDLGGFSL